VVARGNRNRAIISTDSGRVTKIIQTKTTKRGSVEYMDEVNGITPEVTVAGFGSKGSLVELFSWYMYAIQCQWSE
jgi:hypothetical protein